jgi:hypothetical protein
MENGARENRWQIRFALILPEGQQQAKGSLVLDQAAQVVT